MKIIGRVCNRLLGKVLGNSTSASSKSVKEMRELEPSLSGNINNLITTSTLATQYIVQHVNCCTHTAGISEYITTRTSTMLLLRVRRIKAHNRMIAGFAKRILTANHLIN